MDTATEFEFADGTYRFWLPLPQIIELQRKCGLVDNDGKLHPKSVMRIFEEIGEGMGQAGDVVSWMGGGSALVTDINEVVRLGLIGGNEGYVGGEKVEVGPIRAGHLVRDYGYPARPLAEVMAHSWRILHAAIVGIELKKKPEAPAKSAVTRPSRSRKGRSSPTAA